MLTLALIASGCANLGAIAKLSGAGKQAQERFPVLVADLQGSCIRRVDYKELENGDSDQQSFAGAEQEECGQYARFQPALLAAGNTFFAYLDALGVLASNAPPGYRTVLAGLPGKVGNSAAFNPAQTKAFTSLAEFVFDMLSQGYRQSTLAEVIQSHNDDLQAAVVALNSVVVSDYENLLTLEEQEMRSYYLTAIMKSKGQSRLTLILVERQWSEDREALAGRRAGADAFGKMLTEIAKTHGQLAANAGNLDSRAILQSTLEGAAQAAQMAGQFVAAYPER